MVTLAGAAITGLVAAQAVWSSPALARAGEAGTQGGADDVSTQRSHTIPPATSRTRSHIVPPATSRRPGCIRRPERQGEPARQSQRPAVRRPVRRLGRRAGRRSGAADRRKRRQPGLVSCRAHRRTGARFHYASRRRQAGAELVAGHADGCGRGEHAGGLAAAGRPLLRLRTALSPACDGARGRRLDGRPGRAHADGARDCAADRLEDGADGPDGVRRRRERRSARQRDTGS